MNPLPLPLPADVLPPGASFPVGADLLGGLKLEVAGCELVVAAG